MNCKNSSDSLQGPTYKTNKRAQYKYVITEKYGCLSELWADFFCLITIDRHNSNTFTTREKQTEHHNTHTHTHTHTHTRRHIGLYKDMQIN